MADHDMEMVDTDIPMMDYDTTGPFRGLITAYSGICSSPAMIQSPMDGLSGTNHHVSIPSRYHLPVNPRPLKRKRDTPEDRSGERKKQKRKLIQVPPVLVAKVLSYAMDADPTCVLDLLVPDWHVCQRKFRRIERQMEVSRIVTYTRSSDSEASSFRVNFDHDDSDHVFLPTKSFDYRILRLGLFYGNEVIRAFSKESVQVFKFSADAIPANITEESFLEPLVNVFPIRGRRTVDVLPYDDETSPRPKKKTPGGETYIFKLLRHIVIHSPLRLMYADARRIVDPDTQISDANLEALDMDIDFDRASSLWLSWSQMPMLESVLLDLRVYSHDTNTWRGIVSKEDVIRRAREMCRCLRLKLLVIAGLQSYSFKVSYRCYTVQRIEEDDEIDGEPNWFKLFMGALRPGGKLILVDRLADIKLS
ncbi:hypothetical protein M434DRAFT_13395 [Hypoxylon sp. CO27-5]|nr:hypothetical protein M434DRAFT_13395 [Hypoxylon sp. CO27-5]